MSNDPLAPVTWAVTTGEIGMTNQAVGLAEAVGLPVITKVIRVPKPWRWLRSHWIAPLGIEALRGPGSDTFEAPWPRLLVTCGRRSGALSIAVKRASRGRTLTVHVQNPQVPFHHFDRVVAPEHDGVSGPNVVTSLGALHKVTPAKLAEGADRWRETFAALPRPLVAVLVGGTSGACQFTEAEAHQLANRLAMLAKDKGVGLVVTPSRRTGEENTRILRETLEPLGALVWDGQGDNPYFGMLALADTILVTEESISMVSEACYSGKPVYTIDLQGENRRLARFHQLMRQRGYAQPFTGTLTPWSPPMALDETKRHGLAIRALLDGA
ncbi:MAG: mitochondrial fission ELM1 family protein [Rhodospirillum sp.]|nr:mitochondrial fission ELM1 family protein [Rhodospirillum sp.]MCF8488334.1 mitochondrial fission ELM1 family protein [Rhodospirillum sp.]MCF8500755.1 mitochondrial fission ELM1 family protein [Rhodospirillum sp.]